MRTSAIGLWITGMMAAASLAQEAARPGASFVLPQEMAAAREDVWGEAAIRAPGGPSYELFADRLPPLRYVNTAFRHYPLALCAPAAKVKARWISNGSGVNLRADKPPMWREVGTPVSFLVGSEHEAFGSDIKRLIEPKYQGGHLPIVQVAYDAGGTRYEQEAFAPVRGDLAEHGAVFVRLTAARQAGEIVAAIGGEAELQVEGSWILAAAGSGIVGFGPAWKWNAERRELRAALAAGESATLLIATRPIDSPLPVLPAYDDERRACIETWQTILHRGTQLKIPEPIVQDAWRSLVIGNYLLADDDRMNYSAGNAYDHLYESECGDATRAMLQFGQTADARRMVGPLLDFNRQATRYHVAGHKLQLLAHYYWTTRDAEYLREKRSVWQPVIEFIRTSRLENGLLPKDNYAGDIPQQVLSLNSNANCWRGLRDMAEVIAELGDKAAAEELRAEAAAFRQAILAAVAKSERKDTQPPFIPIALLADEPAHDPLTETRMGSYYDLMAPYVLGSGVFAPGSERETWMIDYLRQHGGIAMGMIRSMPHQGEFNQQPGVNVLYGLRYMQTILRRGDGDHALVGFYGHLAQAMARGTFVGGEGSRFFHGDELGRSFYLPPNSASNAMFLTTLRYLLIQDWDLDNDGRPETLRLLDAIPPRWLKDGAELSVEKAPTAFGDISFRVESRLRAGQIHLSVSPLSHRPSKWTLRLPDPPGHVIQSIKLGDLELVRDGEGRVELPAADKAVTITAHVQPRVAAKLNLPPRPDGAPTGSEFARQIESLSPTDREAEILREITRGNVPEFLRELKPISVEAADVAGTNHTATCFVTPDCLAVGSDHDFFRVPMRPKTAQAIADACEASLITAKISDEVFRQAEVKLEPRPLTKDRDATATFCVHHHIIEEQRKGQPLGLLVAGIKKDVVLTNRLAEKPNRVAIYGWHYPSGRPIQPLYVGHTDSHVDYSHGIRLLSNQVLVDGRERAVAEVLRDPVLHILLSGEGPIALGYK